MIKNYINILIIILCLILNFNTHANIYKDETVSIANNDIILKSEIKKHMAALNLLININNKNLNKFAINDIIDTKLQLRIAEKYGVQISKKEINDVYKQFTLNNKLSTTEYNDLIKKHNINQNEITTFIKENLIIEKLHEKLFHQNLTVSRNEIINSSKTSNNSIAKYKIFDYKILKLSINRNKNNENNLNNIHKLITLLKKNNSEYEIIQLNSNKELNLKSKILNINPSNTLNSKIKNILIKNLDKNFIGPLYTKNKIEFIKIIDKINKNDMQTKINHFFIKKNNKNCNKLNLKNNKKNLYKIKNKNFKKNWLHNLNLPEKIYENINNLNINEFSNIIETPEGWHIIKILYKEYSKNSEVNKILTNEIKNKKIKKTRKNWIKNIKKESYIKINDTNIF